MHHRATEGTEKKLRIENSEVATLQSRQEKELHHEKRPGARAVESKGPGSHAGENQWRERIPARVGARRESRTSGPFSAPVFIHGWAA